MENIPQIQQDKPIVDNKTNNEPMQIDDIEEISNNNNSLLNNDEKKSDNNVSMNIGGGEETKQNIPHKKERNSLIRLPLAKIKNIMKLDNDIKLCQKNAYLIIGKLTELFLSEIASESEKICKLSKRKTINLEDISNAIERNDKYAFIDISSIFHVEMIHYTKRTQSEKKTKKEKKGEETQNEGEEQQNQPKKKRGGKSQNKKGKQSPQEVTNNKTIESMFTNK